MKNLSLNILGYLLIVSFLISTGCKKEEEIPVPALSVPTVITDSVEHIQVPYALCSGTVQDTGSGKILRFGFCWSTTPNPAVDNPNSSVIDAGQLEFNHFWASITPIGYNITYCN